MPGEPRVGKDVRWRFGQYIEGRWREAIEAEVLRSPATERPFAEVAVGTEADIDDAVLAARRAFDEGPWSRMSVDERVRRLEPLVSILTDAEDELVDMEVAELGAARRTATMLHVGTALSHLEGLLDVAKRLVVEEARPLPAARPYGVSTVLREPIGVCAAVTPFNFPLLLHLWKVVPALVMGNTVVAKPASNTPLSTLAFADALETCDLPPGVFNVVTVPGKTAGHLVAHSAVDKVSFTGSTPVGREIYAAASATIKRVSMELGGKSPSIVLDDADLNVAIDGVLFGVFFFAGQCCEAGTRLLVPKAMQDEVIERLVRRCQALKVGDPDSWDTDVGPVISAEQRDRIEGFLTRAADDGATIACGGKRPAQHDVGYYLEPAVVADVRPEMEIAREEVFGPVLSVMAYDDIDDAIRIANDTDFGLAATVWSEDLEAANAVARRVRAGTVWINDHHMLRPDVPFGGYKQSGLGRELGPEGFYLYSETKHIWMSLERSLDYKFYSVLLSPEQ